MKKLVVLTMAFVLAAGILIAQQTAPLSPWAYGFDAPAAAPGANAAPAAGRGQGGGAAGGGGGGLAHGPTAGCGMANQDEPNKDVLHNITVVGVALAPAVLGPPIDGLPVSGGASTVQAATATNGRPTRMER